MWMLVCRCGASGNSIMSLKKQHRFADWVASFIAIVITKQQDTALQCLPKRSGLMQCSDGMKPAQHILLIHVEAEIKI